MTTADYSTTMPQSGEHIRASRTLTCFCREPGPRCVRSLLYGRHHHCRFVPELGITKLRNHLFPTDEWIAACPTYFEGLDRPRKWQVSYFGGAHLTQLASTLTRVGWTSFCEFVFVSNCRGVSQNETPLRLARISNCNRAMQSASSIGRELGAGKATYAPRRNVPEGSGMAAREAEQDRGDLVD